MANSSQARKRARQGQKRRALHMSQRSMLRTSIKRVLALVKQKNASAATTAYHEATSMLDRFAAKNLHHPNKAARLKRRLNQRLKALSQAAS